MEITYKKKLGRLYFKESKKMIYNQDDSPFLRFTLNGDLIANNGIISESSYSFDRYIFSTGELDIHENDIVLGGRRAAIVRYNSLWGARFCVVDKESGQEYYSNYADFPNITKVLGNVHQNPELLDLIKSNPQPLPEEDKVDFIDFSLPENDTLDMDHMTEHLIKQEVGMFLHIGKPITQDDVDFISKRRGFNANQKNFMISILKMNELGKSLEFDTTHESIRRNNV